MQQTKHAGLKVLLTGGAGFIGSHLAEALLRQRVQLTIVDVLDEFYSPAWKRANLADVRNMGAFDLIEADICDFAAIRNAVSRTKPEVIIHLAARAGVRPSIAHPRLYEKVNVAGTVNLLELAHEFSVPRFIFGSSSSVYGPTSRAPFTEDHVEGRPISPYAATKLAGELLCYTYAHLYNIAIVSLRFFTVYGPRQRPDLAIHKFIALVEAGKSIPVFGDGTMGRDYTYVDDIVAGVLASLDYQMPPGVPYDVFNLGNSSPVKLNEMIAAIEHATGKRAIREQKPLQPGDVPLTWADVSKSARLLGYKPATPFAQGLEKMVAWYRAADPSRRA